MTTAEFIDVVLTPIGGGIGAAIGYWFVRKRKTADELAAMPKWSRPPIVGVCVAMLLFAFKLMPT